MVKFQILIEMFSLKNLVWQFYSWKNSIVKLFNCIQIKNPSFESITLDITLIFVDNIT